MITCIILSLILISASTFTDSGRQIMSVTAPPTLARHVSQKVRHDEAHRTANAHVGQFAPRRQAFDGALRDGKKTGGLRWLQKAYGLCALWISHRAAFRLWGLSPGGRRILAVQSRTAMR